jgi:anti-sigma regulatory factor (Ser/Thr protein kinase)
VNRQRHFTCEPESVTAARRWVRELLEGNSAEVVEAAELMTSELATNCVRHARTDFELTISSGDGIRVEVRDTGSGRPEVLSPAAEEPSGRGLRIIDALADEWGIIPASSGKSVWFVLEAGTQLADPRGETRLRGTPQAQEKRSCPRLLSLWSTPRASVS